MAEERPPFPFDIPEEFWRPERDDFPELPIPDDVEEEEDTE